MTMEQTDANSAPEPEARKIGGRLRAPLVPDYEYLQSLGYSDTEIVCRGVAMVAVHERKIRGVRV